MLSVYFDATHPPSAMLLKTEPQSSLIQDEMTSLPLTMCSSEARTGSQVPWSSTVIIEDFLLSIMFNSDKDFLFTPRRSFKEQSFRSKIGQFHTLIKFLTL